MTVQAQAEQTQKKGQSKAQNAASSAQGTNAAMKGGTDIQADEVSAQNETVVEKVKKALQSGDGKAVNDALGAATANDVKTIAKDQALVDQIMQIPDQAERNAALDRIYMDITNVNVLIQMVNARFGVPMGSNMVDVKDAADARSIINGKKNDRYDPRDEQKWTLNGVQHAYKTYLVLPQSDLDLIRVVMTFNTKNGCGGAAYSRGGKTMGMYYVDYTDSNINRTEKGEHTENKKDTRTGLVLTDMTFAHELGHIVDLAQATPYSSTDDFRKISGWEEHIGVDNIYKGILDSVETPWAGDMDENEKTVAESTAKRMLNERASNEAMADVVIKDEVLNNYNEPEKNTGKRSFGEAVADFFTNIFGGNKKAGRTADNLIKILKKSDLIKHIQRGFSNNTPWYSGELFKGMRRQIHEGYENQGWYSFANEAWKGGKISKYQFRDPKEEFAETYASYHVASPKGSKTPAKLKAWFESKGLDKADDIAGNQTADHKEDKSE